MGHVCIMGCLSSVSHWLCSPMGSFLARIHVGLGSQQDSASPWGILVPEEGDDTTAGPIPASGTGMQGDAGHSMTRRLPHACPASLFLHGQLSVRGGTVVIVKMQMNKIIILAENF